MSTWKKIIISGSDAILNSVTASNGYFGTASFAINASTASFLSGTVVSASYATTASFATTASYVSNVPPPSTMNITDDNTNAVYYPVFVDGAGSGKTLYADTTTTPISINPNTGEFKLSNTLKIQSNVNGNRIAIGHDAGKTSQGTSSIAIGYNAGNDFQGNFAVAMGYGAGAASQGEYGTAIGTQTGGTTQGTGSTAVGYQAGLSAQGNYSVAIGYQAGVLSLGESSIAIGRNAGYSNQPAKTIIINASGSGYTINGVANQTSSFYVAPIRASTYTSGALYYNSTTNEITSLLPGTATTVTSASFASTASYVLQSVSASFATTSSYVSNVPNIINNASLGRILLSDGTTNAATASSNLSWNSGNESLDITNGGIEQIGAGYTSTFAGGVTINGSLTATSSKAVSSSFASTASYVLNAVSSSFASTASFVNTLTQNVTVSGSIFLSGSLNTATFIDYEERFTSPTISAGVLTLNLANGNVFDVALNANTTLTISNPPAANNAGSFVLIFTADGNPRVVSWGASILWPGGTAPTLTSTNGKKDVFGFISLNSGTNWYGFIGGQNI